MDRRTALATAGAVALTALAGATAMAANVGILGHTPATPHIGQLSPIADVRSDSSPQGRTTIETIVVEEPAPTTTTVASAPVSPSSSHDSRGSSTWNGSSEATSATAPPATAATNPPASTESDAAQAGDDHGHASHPDETEPVAGADDDD
jgi:hypothetical protein